MRNLLGIEMKKLRGKRKKKIEEEESDSVRPSFELSLSHTHTHTHTHTLARSLARSLLHSAEDCHLALWLLPSFALLLAGRPRFPRPSANIVRQAGLLFEGRFHDRKMKMKKTARGTTAPQVRSDVRDPKLLAFVTIPLPRHILLFIEQSHALCLTQLLKP